MPSAYPQRALTVLLLFGTLSAAVALLCSNLIFQLPSGRAAPGVGAAPGAGAGLGALPEPVAAALVPVPAVLAALCLVINVSCFLLCLLHGYFSTELCRGHSLSPRAGWFLLHSRSVRHVALGLFCCGLCLYLTGECSTIPSAPQFPVLHNSQCSTIPSIPGIPSAPQFPVFPVFPVLPVQPWVGFCSSTGFGSQTASPQLFHKFVNPFPNHSLNSQLLPFPAQTIP
uniref:Uncharacterized protein n=1 Tax=Catharus ustulatus TaxID=91951 RepID=A0A8C3UDH2_CATUS